MRWYSRFQSPVETNTVAVTVTAQVSKYQRTPGPGRSTVGTFIIQYIQFSPMKQADDYPFMEEEAGAHRSFKNLLKVPVLGSVGAESGLLGA